MKSAQRREQSISKGISSKKEKRGDHNKKQPTKHPLQKAKAKTKDKTKGKNRDLVVEKIHNEEECTNNKCDTCCKPRHRRISPADFRVKNVDNLTLFSVFHMILKSIEYRNMGFFANNIHQTAAIPAEVSQILETISKYTAINGTEGAPACDWKGFFANKKQWNKINGIITSLRYQPGYQTSIRDSFATPNYPNNSLFNLIPNLWTRLGDHFYNGRIFQSADACQWAAAPTSVWKGRDKITLKELFSSPLAAIFFEPYNVGGMNLYGFPGLSEFKNLEIPLSKAIVSDYPKDIIKTPYLCFVWLMLQQLIVAYLNSTVCLDQMFYPFSSESVMGLGFCMLKWFGECYLCVPNEPVPVQFMTLTASLKRIKDAICLIKTYNELGNVNLNALVQPCSTTTVTATTTVGTSTSTAITTTTTTSIPRPPPEVLIECNLLVSAGPNLNQNQETVIENNCDCEINCDSTQVIPDCPSTPCPPSPSQRCDPCPTKGPPCCIADLWTLAESFSNYIRELQRNNLTMKARPSLLPTGVVLAASATSLSSSPTTSLLSSSSAGGVGSSSGFPSNLTVTSQATADFDMKLERSIESWIKAYPDFDATVILNWKNMIRDVFPNQVFLGAFSLPGAVFQALATNWVEGILKPSLVKNIRLNHAPVRLPYEVVNDMRGSLNALSSAGRFILAANDTFTSAIYDSLGIFEGLYATSVKDINAYYGKRTLEGLSNCMWQYEMRRREWGGINPDSTVAEFLSLENTQILQVAYSQDGHSALGFPGISNIRTAPETSSLTLREFIGVVDPFPTTTPGHKWLNIITQVLQQILTCWLNAGLDYKQQINYRFPLKTAFSTIPYTGLIICADMILSLQNPVIFTSVLQQACGTFLAWFGSIYKENSRGAYDAKSGRLIRSTPKTRCKCDPPITASVFPEPGILAVWFQEFVSLNAQTLSVSFSNLQESEQGMIDDRPQTAKREWKGRKPIYGGVAHRLTVEENKKEIEEKEEEDGAGATDDEMEVKTAQEQGQMQEVETVGAEKEDHEVSGSAGPIISSSVFSAPFPQEQDEEKSQETETEAA